MQTPVALKVAAGNPSPPRRRALAAAALAGLWSACGQTTPTARDAAAPSSDAATDAGDAAPGQVWRGDVAVGACGVSRRIPLPTSPDDFSAHVSREGQGFVLAPWSTSGAPPLWHWLRVDPSGERRAEYTIASPDQHPVVSSLSLGVADQLIQIVVSGDPVVPGSIDSLYVTRLFHANETTPRAEQILLSAFSRATIRAGAVAALDGRQGLFAVGHIGVHGPRLAVLATNGERVGAVAPLATSDLWHCDTLVPTEHAGAYAVVEAPPAGGLGQIFHLLELSATGAPLLEVRVPFNMADGPDGKVCPLVALTGNGFAALTFEPGAAAAKVWKLHMIARDGAVSSEIWDTLHDRPRALVVKGDAAIVVVGNSTGTEIIKRSGGRDQRFALSLPFNASAIPSEAGTLFLDVTDQSVSPETRSRKIVEVICP